MLSIPVGMKLLLLLCDTNPSSVGSVHVGTEHVYYRACMPYGSHQLAHCRNSQASIISDAVQLIRVHSTGPKPSHEKPSCLHKVIPNDKLQPCTTSCAGPAPYLKGAPTLGITAPADVSSLDNKFNIAMFLITVCIFCHCKVFILSS